LDDPELFAAPRSGVTGAGITTPIRRKTQQHNQTAGMQQQPAAAAAAAAPDPDAAGMQQPREAAAAAVGRRGVQIAADAVAGMQQQEASAGAAGLARAVPSAAGMQQDSEMQHAAAAAAAAAAGQRRVPDEEEADLLPAKRARRAAVPFVVSQEQQFTGRLAGQTSRADCSSGSQSELEDVDIDMQDTEVDPSTGRDQDSMLQFTPRTLFPSIGGHRPGTSKLNAEGLGVSKMGGFSIKLVGSSSYVPSLATYITKSHAVAEYGECFNNAECHRSNQQRQAPAQQSSKYYCCCKLGLGFSALSPGWLAQIAGQ